MARKHAREFEDEDLAIAAPARPVSRRVMVLIKRPDDVTTSYAKVVWEHEIPILQAVHGIDAVEPDEDEESTDGAAANKAAGFEIIPPSVLDQGYTAKPNISLMPYWNQQSGPGTQKHKIEQADPPARPSEAAKIGWVFVGDPRAEYNRLAAVYGKHREVNQLVVEYIYGRYQEGKFSRAVKHARLEDLPAGQLRELLRDVGVDNSALIRAEVPELLVLCEEHGITIG